MLIAAWDLATFAEWLRVRLLDCWLVFELLRLLVFADSTMDFLRCFVERKLVLGRPEVQGVAAAVAPKAAVKVPLGMHAECPTVTARR